MPETTKAQWESILSTLMADLEKGTYESTISMAGHSFTYRSLTELQRWIQYVEGKIAEFEGGPFGLAQFIDA